MEDAEGLSSRNSYYVTEVGNSGLTQIIELQPGLEIRLTHDLFNSGVLNKSELVGFTQHA